MAVLKGGLAQSKSKDGHSAAMPATSGGGYPSTGGASALPVANFSASDRWRALGGSEGAPRQLAEGCRWVGGAKNVEIDSNLIRQCTEGTEAGKITDLNCHFKFVQQISGLEQFVANLRSLDLSTNNIRVMEGLKGATKLRELKLYSCQISRIENLEHCVTLMALHLEDNSIGAIEGLDRLGCLEYLNMDSNRVQKIGRGLCRLSRLRELHLSNNQLSSLDGLAGLANLETCAVDHNRLCQVTAEQVKGLSKLDELHLAGNQLQSLSFLATGASKSFPSLPSLVQLDASNNNLSSASLRDLPPLPQLGELNLAGNQIEEIFPTFVSAFPSLEILDLGGNQLHRGAQDLTELKEIASLRELTVQGNPFLSKSQPEEVEQTLSILSCLEFLDDQPLERKAEAQILALDGGPEDTETFPLTVTKGVGDGQQRPGTAGSQRPGTAVGSRPGTSGSQRPGTAQKMVEAGVKAPLMQAKPKLSDKRFASEEQVLQWERQTLSGLLAVQKQIEKTSRNMDSDLQDMSKFLHHADKVIEREKELSAKRPASPGVGASEAPTFRSTPAARANTPDSRVKVRLRAAVEQGREDGEEGDEDVDELLLDDTLQAGSLPPSPSASPSRLSPAAAVAAACDEEIEEDDPLAEASPVPSSPEPEEVDEELHIGEANADASALTLGPRAVRAMVTAAGTVAASAAAPRGRDQPGLHVDTRAKDRVSLQQRPSSRGSQGSVRSQGKMGSQPSQGPRVRAIPTAPVRTSSRGAKR